jgi:hypothetical protein
VYTIIRFQHRLIINAYFINNSATILFHFILDGKRPLERPRRGWEDGIRLNLGEIGTGGCGVDSIGSSQGPMAGSGECGSGATELVS